MKKTNDYEVQEDYVIMYTSKGEMFLVDLEDFERVRKYCWHFDCHGYVRAKAKNGHRTNEHIMLHRFIMGFPKDMLVDHIHGRDSKYDNRKSNLRIATPQQNLRNKPARIDNKSGVVGVCWIKQRGSWKSYIYVSGRCINLGYYNNFNDAVEARKKAENRYFGEWSYDNSQQS